MTLSRLQTQLSPVICTSSTRPASPFIGMSIFETDTGNELTWYDPPGAAVVGWYQSWNKPWGRVGYAKSTTSQTGISALTDLTGMSAACAVVAGRLIRITGETRIIQQTSLGFVEMYALVGATVLDRKGKPCAASGADTVHVDTYDLPAATATVTYKLQLGTTAGTVDTVLSGAAPLINSVLIAEDIGPA